MPPTPLSNSFSTRRAVAPGLQSTFTWSRDLPDFRDQTPAAIGDALAALKRRAPRAARPDAVDLREYFAPVGDDESPTSSAAAVSAMVQYFERRASGRLFQGSVEFLDYTTRRLTGLADGATVSTAAPIGLRSTLKALVRFGCPPSHVWLRPNAAALDHGAEPRTAVPDSFCYGFQRDFAELRYVRLDAPGTSGADVLKQVKSFVAAGFACVCGAALPESISAAADIPYPTRHDALLGGAALTVVGYDDAYRIRSQKGALLVRATFGAAWGAAGFGYLPYRYVEEFAACDFWTVLRPDWLKSREFEQPR